VWPQLEGKINFLSIAVDGQGAAVVKPWVEQANATFTTVVDQHNALADSVGFNAIPTLLLFDANGKLVYGPVRFEVREPGMVEAVLDWVDGKGVGGALVRPRMAMANSSEAARLFRLGQARLAEGDHAGAMDLWRQARDLEPNNWLIRKQIWAVENPDRFYSGPVDFDWQREQLARERQ
jgi:hypothetical protein